MNGDEPRDGGRSITDRFNNRKSWANSGHSKRGERTDPASNGFSGHQPEREHSGEPYVTTIGQDIGNFFKVLFAFFKGIWTQDFADFDLLSSVYFPPQPKSEVEVPAPQPQITVPPPQIPRQPESKTPAETKKEPEERQQQQQTKQEEKPSSSASSGDTGQKPLAPKTAEEPQQKLSPTQDFKGSSAPAEKPLSSVTQQKTEPSDQRSPIQKSVDTMLAMRKDSKHPYWDLPLSELAGRLTHGIKGPANIDDMIQRVLMLEGGGKVNEHEPNGGISKYGINSKIYPDLDIRNLTEKEAVKILREDYWKKIEWPGGGVNKMSQAVHFIAFDTAVNSQSYVNKLLRDSYKEAGGDVTKMPKIMLDMRQKRYDDLIEKNPKKFAKFEKGWHKRIEELRKLTGQYAMTAPTAEIATKLAILKPVDFPTTSHFGLREDPHKHGTITHHHGTDYKTPMGTPVAAKLEGDVFKVATYNGYGKTLIVSHGNGLLFQVYAHLNEVMVKEGQHISVDDVMAKTGKSGKTTGPHLHHELWIREKDKFYVIDEIDAISKDLSDPAVRKQLIERAHMVEPALFKDAAFRKAALELQERKPAAGEDGTLVASIADTAPAPLATR
ncbi:MAG: hypothetical protein DYH13_05350 [Alphaproteobacteria bacterium PRO2]|nr:hypothetical protein [Alphaproteobacteria bacterium PRO2]